MPRTFDDLESLSDEQRAVLEAFEAMDENGDGELTARGPERRRRRSTPRSIHVEGAAASLRFIEGISPTPQNIEPKRVSSPKTPETRRRRRSTTR